MFKAEVAFAFHNYRVYHGRGPWGKGRTRTYLWTLGISELVSNTMMDVADKCPNQEYADLVNAIVPPQWRTHGLLLRTSTNSIIHLQFHGMIATALELCRGFIVK